MLVKSLRIQGIFYTWGQEIIIRFQTDEKYALYYNMGEGMILKIEDKREPRAQVVSQSNHFQKKGNTQIEEQKIDFKTVFVQLGFHWHGGVVYSN